MIGWWFCPSGAQRLSNSSETECLETFMMDMENKVIIR